jgi:hypothetical protein
MRLFHTTTTEKAASIMCSGFRDNATVNPRLTHTRFYEAGVWFGDIPALDDELFDGIGLFDFDAERQAFIAVDVPFEEMKKLLETGSLSILPKEHDPTWPGDQFWAKAEVWNSFPRLRIDLDDIIRLRLTSTASTFDPGWLHTGRDYQLAFKARVERAWSLLHPEMFPPAPNKKPKRRRGRALIQRA